MKLQEREEIQKQHYHSKAISFEALTNGEKLIDESLAGLLYIKSEKPRKEGLQGEGPISHSDAISGLPDC